LDFDLAGNSGGFGLVRHVIQPFVVRERW
jgi:hypothetical protein